MKDRIFTALLGLCIILLIITFSIGLPIYVRPFYYMQIETLGISDICGEDYSTVKEGYDQVLDYLTLPGKEFGSGVFSCSPEAEAHFEDCRILFDLNLYVFIGSLTMTVLLLILAKRGVFTVCRPFGLNLAFSSGVFTLLGFALLGGVVAIDFDKAFTVFHRIFFPGKDNWMFDWNKDSIIRILPQDFFMNCAILIFSSIILLCLGCIVFSLIGRARRRR